MSVYNFKAKDINGNEISLESYKGKNLLIVNTASECGFTPQYEKLQQLKEKYQDELEILAFPCNQFGGQESGSDQEIKEFCDLRFNISFPLFSKIEVNGKNAHPLFEYLKESLPGVLGTKKIKWNFTKFFVDKDGKPVKRFAPNDDPGKVEALLKQRPADN